MPPSVLCSPGAASHNGAYVVSRAAVGEKQGLSRRTFVDDVAREMCDAGLHVDPAALADAFTRPTL